MILHHYHVMRMKSHH